MRNTPMTRWMAVFVVVLFLVSGICMAEGNIDPTEKYSWSSQAGWLNFSPTHGGVTVVPDGANGYLKGFVWAENIGWIKLGAGSGAGPYANTSAADWGVNMDAAGNLSGYGWTSHAGWINFHPAHGQATIDPVTGAFGGVAWGENVGWISFRGDSPAYGVRAELQSSVENWALY